MPSELLLLRPATTITHSSSAAINHALMNPASTNHFFSVLRDRRGMLGRNLPASPHRRPSGRRGVRAAARRGPQPRHEPPDPLPRPGEGGVWRPQTVRRR